MDHDQLNGKRNCGCVIDFTSKGNENIRKSVRIQEVVRGFLKPGCIFVKLNDHLSNSNRDFELSFYFARKRMVLLHINVHVFRNCLGTPIFYTHTLTSCYIYVRCIIHANLHVVLCSLLLESSGGSPCTCDRSSPLEAGKLFLSLFNKMI